MGKRGGFDYHCDQWLLRKCHGLEHQHVESGHASPCTMSSGHEGKPPSTHISGYGPGRAIAPFMKPISGSSAGSTATHDQHIGLLQERSGVERKSAGESEAAASIQSRLLQIFTGRTTFTVENALQLLTKQFVKPPKDEPI